VEEGAAWLGKSLISIFKHDILGPSTPGISKIRNYYIRTIIIKIPQKQSLVVSKNQIQRVKNAFQSINEFRSVKFNIDVDNY
jgi:primosomal protein N' (replication factor Y)